jgi:hypothetical protein
MANYTLTYTAVARNVSKAALANAWNAVPRDFDPELVLGLLNTGDNAVAGGGNTVVRTITYTGAAGQSAFLENLNTVIFSKALCTPVVADRVIEV